MSSDKTKSSQACVCRCHKGWWVRTERLLSTSCMGWCLQAAYKEHPKAAAMACAGGASSVFLVNSLVNRDASQKGSQMLLRAGGLISGAGIACGMLAAFDEHSKAAMKACLAGALSVCLAKSLILRDPPATEIKTSSKIETPSKIKTMTDVDDCDKFKACVDFPEMIQNQIKQIGKDLKWFSKIYCEGRNREMVDKLLADPFSQIKQIGKDLKWFSKIYCEERNRLMNPVSDFYKAE